MEKKIAQPHHSATPGESPIPHAVHIQAHEYFLIGCSAVLFCIGFGLLLFSTQTNLQMIATILVMGGIGIWVYLWFKGFRAHQLGTEKNAISQHQLQSENRRLMAKTVKLTNDLDEFENQQTFFDRIIEISETLTATTDVQSTLSKIVNLAIAATKADTGSLILLDGSLEVTGAIFPNRDMRPDKVLTLANQVLANGIAGWAVDHKQPAIVFDAAEDDRWVSMPDAPYRDRSALSVPLMQQQTIIGVLTLIHNLPHHFGNRDLDILVHASHQIVMALSSAQIFEEQRALIDRQAVLYEVLQGISQQNDPTGTAQNITDTVVALTGWSVCTILVPDPEKTRLKVLAVSPPSLTNAKHLTIDENNHMGQVIINRKIDLNNDLASEESNVFKHQAIRSELFVPMVMADQTVGVLYLADREPYRFLQEDVALARSIAEATTMTIANANLLQALSDQSGRLNAIIETNRDGLILVDPENEILVVNHNALAFLSVSEGPTTWLGKNIDDLYKALDGQGDELIAAIQSELKHNSPTRSPSNPIEFTVGRRILQITFLPIIVQRIYIGRVISLRDITGQQLVEKLRRELTHTMVHDLRNPLHIISTGISVLRSLLEPGLNDDPEQSQLVNIIETNSEKMLHLVNGILDISRLESQRMPINIESFNLEAEINEATLAIEPLAHEKNVEIQKEMAANTKLAQGDRELIARVLQNLLDNGLKFTRENSTVRIETRRSKSGEKIELSITDQGHGIPEYLEDSLFEKFQTGHIANSGSGLGLAFCKMAVEAQNEKIWISNSSDEGTTFTFTISPFQPDQERNADQTSTANSQ